MANSRARQLGALVVSFVCCFAAAAIGAAASVQAGPFYLGLARPAWAPPASVFGPVWTLLYAAMAVAAWLVWRRTEAEGRRGALLLFAAQLVVNALWSWLFFAWHQGGAAFADIVLLWVLVAATLVAFWRIRPAAGMLLLPYLAWVSFAAGLNFAMWRLNPALLG